MSHTSLDLIVSRIERALATGDLKGAAAHAERGLAQGLTHPIVFRTIAQARIEAGRFAEAGDLLNRALALSPVDPDCLCALGMLLVREGRADEGAAVFAQVLRVAPEHYRAWLGLANALEALEHDEKALTAYERAAALQPREPAPHAGVAELSLRAGRRDEALAAAEQALALDASNPVATLVAARVALGRKQADEARRRMEALIVRGKLTPFEQSTALKTLADALDQLDRIPEAIGAYERMNRGVAAQHRPRFGPGGRVENHMAFIERLHRGYAGARDRWRSAPAEIAPSPVKRHVFVMGYPRSGNTLVAAVLGASPRAYVLEERPTLNDADLAFLRDEAGLERLSSLDGEEAERLRSLYWARVRSETPDLDGALLIDMAPLNSIKLPMIRKLFPSAVIILCRRDPRDVVLSCWRQNFKVNASTYQMTDLVGTARHYDAAMRLTGDAVSMIGDENLYRLDYDDFIADFQWGARRLLQAVGAEWTDGVLTFAEAAKGRRLRTASADQIRGGLFDGRGQWKLYEAYLQPVMPILEPWLRPSNAYRPMFTSPDPAMCLVTAPDTRATSTSPEPAMNAETEPATPRNFTSPEPAMCASTLGEVPPSTVTSPEPAILALRGPLTDAA